MSSFTLASNTPSSFPLAHSGVPSVAAKCLAWTSAHWTLLTSRTSAASPKALTPFQEAEQLRAMANTYVESDPGFAQDLYAAADRHEIEHGVSF